MFLRPLFMQFIPLLSSILFCQLFPLMSFNLFCQWWNRATLLYSTLLSSPTVVQLSSPLLVLISLLLLYSPLSTASINFYLLTEPVMLLYLLTEHIATAYDDHMPILNTLRTFYVKWAHYLLNWSHATHCYCFYSVLPIWMPILVS